MVGQRSRLPVARLRARTRPDWKAKTAGERRLVLAVDLLGPLVALTCGMVAGAVVVLVWIALRR